MPGSKEFTCLPQNFLSLSHRKKQSELSKGLILDTEIDLDQQLSKIKEGPKVR